MSTCRQTGYVQSVELFERDRKLHFCRLSSSIPNELIEKIWLQQKDVVWPEDAETLKQTDFENELRAFIKRLEDSDSRDVFFWKGILEMYHLFESSYDPKGIFLCMNGLAFINVGQEEKLFDNLVPEMRDLYTAPVWIEFGRLLDLPEYRKYAQSIAQMDSVLQSPFVDEQLQQEMMLETFEMEEELKSLYIQHPFGHKEPYENPYIMKACHVMLWCILLLLNVDTDDMFCSPSAFGARLDKITKRQFLSVFQCVALDIWIPYRFQDLYRDE